MIEKILFDGGMEYLKKERFPMGDVLSNKSQKDLIDDAKTSIIESLNGTASSFVSNISINGRKFNKNAVVFAVASIMMRAINNRILVQKYALAHSQRAEKMLAVKIAEGDHDMAFSMMNYKPYQGDYLVFVPDYLARSVDINEPSWKLVNRVVDGGHVKLKLRELTRLLRKDIMSDLEERIMSLNVTDETAKLIKGRTDEIITKIPKRRAINVGKTGWPPCIISAIEFLKKGGNLNHTGRFMLATYLTKTGLGPDRIAEFFVNAPDYSEQTTTMQIKQIQNSEYLVPSCSKLDSAGLCYRNDDCGDIINPMTFRKKRRSRK